MTPLAEEVLAGQKRAIAKAITWVEDQVPGYRDLMADLHPQTGNAHVIGVTGSPGAGKSTLISTLVGHLREQNIKVGVLAVDPTSPLTGGAVLGDRVRMVAHALDEGVFIRSLGSRGHAGGVSLIVRNATRILDAAGYQVVLVETVGVGQVELAVARATDTVLLAINPESGDDIQALKAGILEVADVITVTKGDLPGAQAAKGYLEGNLGTTKDWQPPVLLTSAKADRGLDALWLALMAHRKHLIATREGARRHRDQARAEVEVLIQHAVHRHLQRFLDGYDWDTLFQRMEVEHAFDPQQAADKLLASLPWPPEGRSGVS